MQPVNEYKLKETLIEVLVAVLLFGIGIPLAVLGVVGYLLFIVVIALLEKITLSVAILVFGLALIFHNWY